MLRIFLLVAFIQTVFCTSSLDTHAWSKSVCNANQDSQNRFDDFDEEALVLQQASIDRSVRNIFDRVTSNGYPLETHIAQTEDGYLLTLHRIPFSPNHGRELNKPVVFLQHGLLCSSNDWIITGPENGLAYILADRGYDVWMGNARGNSFSKHHVKLSPKDKDFWDFSWNEIGYYDLPAMIDYVLATSGQKSLNYVGHSQGTTSFFVMASLRPDYNEKIKTMHALAPVAFMSNLKNPFLQVLAPIISHAGIVTSLLGSFEFLPSSELMGLAGSALCKEQSIFQPICENALFLLAGYDADNFNATLLPELVKVTPAGASVNQIIHYAQGIRSGHFRKFDYGVVKNLVKYFNINPPDYPLEKITSPVHLYFGNNDWLAAVEDVQTLAAKVSNLVYKKMVPFKKFNHLDFLYGINVYDLVYTELIKNIEKFE